MSDEQNVIVASLVSFAVGLVVGTVMTLFIAPMSGRDLRGRIQDEAQSEWQRATDQMNRMQEEMRRNADNMRQQMEAYDHRVREQIGAQLNQLQAKIEGQSDTGQDAA